MIKGLAVGRIVHYVEKDLEAYEETPPVHMAAIVSYVGEPNIGNVDLTIFPAGKPPDFRTSVQMDQGARKEKTWHWPEKE